MTTAVVGFCCLALPVAVQARGTATTAALQVALRAHGTYHGSIDGVRGQQTLSALEAFQRRKDLPVTGWPGPRTRKALGRLGGPRPGTRRPKEGLVGWDVSWLEYELASHGFSPGTIDGRYDRETDAAVQTFVKFAGLGHHCQVGRRVFGALSHAKPVRVTVPLTWPLDDRTVVQPYGIRGNHLRTGITIASRLGAGVAAAGTGKVVYADWRPGSLGLVVILRHPDRTTTVYGHMARIDVRVGQRIPRGAFLGLVGRTGSTRVAALYFEVRVRGASINPLRVLR